MASTRPKEPRIEPFAEFADRLRGDRWQPAIDVFETEKTIVVRVEIAGVRSSELRLSVDGDLLRIRGVRTPPSEAELQRLHQMEIEFGPFERIVRIAIPFDDARVTAKVEDGFLCVSLPKRLPSRRRIEIEE